ncbi:Oaz1 [Kluyveromyces lactis]|nr:Oaz1 [Kluyveromyces lactis]
MSRVIHRNELYKRQQRIECYVSGLLDEFSPLAIDFPLIDLTKNKRHDNIDVLPSPTRTDNNSDEFLISPNFYQFKNREWSDVTLRLA